SKAAFGMAAGVVATDEAVDAVVVVVVVVLIRAPYGARRRSPQRGTSGLGTAQRRSLMRSQRQPQQPVLQALVLGQLGHGAAMHHAAVVHHRDTVAERLRHAEVLLDEQPGGLGRFQLA